MLNKSADCFCYSSLLANGPVMTREDLGGKPDAFYLELDHFDAKPGNHTVTWS